MNYTVNGRNYTANDGYVFISKNTGIISKKLRLRNPELLENYDIIIEPIVEEVEAPVEETDNNV